MMKLVSAPPSPWARKVRMVLLEKGIAVTLVDDMPWLDGTVVPELNPLEKLPILIADNGEAIYESRLIVEWIERRFPDPAMLPSDDNGYLLAKRCEVIADGTLDALLLYQREKRRAQPDADWRDRQYRKIRRGTAEAARLLDGRAQAVGERFSLADAAFVALLGALDFCREQGTLDEFDWRAGHPALAGWHDSLADRPSVRETVPLPFAVDWVKEAS